MIPRKKASSIIVDSKKKLTASVKPGKMVIGEYLLWNPARLGPKGVKRTYNRLAATEKKLEDTYRRALGELNKMQESLFIDSSDLKKTLIHTQTCALNVTETKWKKCVLLFRYRKELGLSIEEIGNVRKRLKSLQNNVRDIYKEIEDAKKTDYE